MSEIIIRGNFSIEGKDYNFLPSQLKYLKLVYKPITIKLEVEEFEGAEELATNEQINTLLNLGIDLPVKLTKLEASILIKESLEKKEEKKLPESVQNDNTTSNSECEDLYDENNMYL